jgi:hypothetical protein
MERVTKLLVIGSMAAAISLEAVLGARLWAALLPLTIGSFVAAAGLSLAFEEVSAGVVLFFTYLMPQLFTVLHGDFFGPYGTVWSAALLGVVAPRSIRSSWAVPGRWKGPLILWALTIAVTWPVVALRELDFTLDLLRYGSPGNGTAQVWICEVAVILGLGILWFDWLVNVFTGNEAGFRRWILLPLGASWAITTSVGIYQMFGDMFFLNQTLFGELGRASGTMRDANPFGVVAALGGPALVAAVSLTQDRPLRPTSAAALGAPGLQPNVAATLGAQGLRAIAFCGIVASWFGLWASGSRTALLAGLITSAFVARALWSEWLGQAARPTRFGVATLGALAAAGCMVAVVLLPVGSGPLLRLRHTIPIWSVLGFVKEMWNRNAYGMVATYLIREFPLFGVGVASFHGLATHYYSILTGVYLPPDNAQNWYRHQLVEYGLIGSVGWILWVVLFGWFVMSAGAPQPTRFAATTVKGTLVALATVSLVGMPTQNIAVTVTLWTLAFWYVALVGAPGPSFEQARPGTKTWLAIWTIVALSVSGTAYTSRYWLRPPQRAQADGSPYRYGFYDDEPDSGVRWTAGKAVDVFEIVNRNEDRYLKLDIGAVAPDADQRPVEIKVWRDDDLVLRLRRRSDGVATRYVCVPPGRKMMRMQVEVSRTWRPSDYGRGTDQREHGVAVGKWTFVYDPPKNALVVPCEE